MKTARHHDPGGRGRAGQSQPSWWRRLKRSAAWQILDRARLRWVAEDGDQRAAALAFYLLLSLVPLAILLVAAGTLFVEREVATQTLVDLVNHYMPLTGEQERKATTAMHEWLHARGSISLAALPVLLWSAMKYLRTLIRTTNRVWQAKTYSWWRLPLKSLGLLGITASAVLIGIVLPALAGLTGRWLARFLEVPGWALTLMFQVIPGLVLFYGLIMIYRLAPSRSTRFAEVWLGALMAAGLIWVSGRLFLIYATNFANFDALYGALGGIVAFLGWVYFSCAVAVFGICFCAARAEVREPSEGGARKDAFPT